MQCFCFFPNTSLFILQPCPVDTYQLMLSILHLLLLFLHPHFTFLIHIVYPSYSCPKLHAARQSPNNRILTFPDGYGDSTEFTSASSSCCNLPSSLFSPHPPLCAVRGQSETDDVCVCVCVFGEVCVHCSVSLQAVYTSLEFSTAPCMATVVSH